MISAPSSDFSANSTPKTGLLLVNLGSPDSPKAGDVRRYLAEFLHDKRVIDTSRWIWCLILHGVILRVRPAKSARSYAAIWNEPEGFDGSEAPLIRITRAQVAGVQKRLGESVIVKTAMRYGNPSIADGMADLKSQGCQKIAVLPLYPQYAGATTAAVYDAVHAALRDEMDVPSLRFLRHYYDDPRFITALAESLDTHLAQLDWTPDVILSSYHGLPQSYVDKGDPYQKECLATSDLLRTHMKLDETKLRSTFQSRFGPKAWLQPYTDQTLESLAAEGLKKVALITPGFSADCLETLEEISIEAREVFLKAGGTHFSVVPCLNASEAHLDTLADIAREQLLAGWI